MNEPSPERQNAINRNIDEGIRLVLDGFVNKSQETKESLVKSFTYLTMDHVLEAESKKHKATVSPVVSSKKKPVCLTLAPEITEATPDPQTDDDGIEEQTLDEGTKTGTMTDGAVHRGSRPQRKFDNFVDDAGSDGDDDNDDASPGGYSASFAETGKSVTEGEITQPKEAFLLKEQQLPHATQQATECDLSMLVDEQYDADCVDDDDDVVAHLNPGEVEVLPDNVPTELELLQVTSLDVATTRKTGSEDTPKVTQSEDQECSDQVEAFCLDEDFDYDNVKLTPKFTPQEWEHLQSFIPADSKPS